MPVYQFKSDDGETIERVYSMRSAPELGAIVTENGKRYRRVLSLPGTQQDIKPYTSVTLPKNLPGCKCDSKGRVIIESRAQERAVAKEFL